MIIWVIAGLLGLATGLRIGWALVNKQSLVSTAMILALGSLGLVAALNWQPLTLLLDSLLHWPNISIGLSQVALVACAAGSCVMITTVSSPRKPATLRRIAMWQYGIAVVIADRAPLSRSSPRASRRRCRPMSICDATSAPTDRAVMAAAAAVRDAGAHPGVMGGHAAFESHPPR